MWHMHILTQNRPHDVFTFVTEAKKKSLSPYVGDSIAVKVFEWLQD